MTVKDLRKEYIKFWDGLYCSFECRFMRQKCFEIDQYHYVCVLREEEILKLKQNQNGIVKICRCQQCKDYFKEEN